MCLANWQTLGYDNETGSLDGITVLRAIDRPLRGGAVWKQDLGRWQKPPDEPLITPLYWWEIPEPPALIRR